MATVTAREPMSNVLRDASNGDRRGATTLRAEPRKIDGDGMRSKRSLQRGGEGSPVTLFAAESAEEEPMGGAYCHDGADGWRYS